MISFKKIRYLVLAGLMISLPAQPMGWFDTPWKKVAGIAAVAALAGLVYGISYYKYKKEIYSRFMKIAGREGAVLASDSHESLESMIKEHRDFYDKQTLNILLFRAARGGKNKIVGTLLKYGADINAQKEQNSSVYIPDRDGEGEVIIGPIESPILIAILNGRLSTIKLLMEHGAHLEIRQKEGSYITVYDYIRGDNAEIRQVLDEHRCKKYSDNQNAIEREIFSVATSLPKPLTKITAAYAAEYPLMARRPLVFKEEQEKVQEVPMIEAPAQVPHPLSLDVQAI